MKALILFLIPASLTAQTWTHGPGVFPCSTQTPNTIAVNPNDGLPYYLRYDASAIWASDLSTDEAINAGFGGGMHTVQYIIRVSSNDLRSWYVPLRSGQVYPGPGTQYPAPYRDAPVRNRPGKTLCGEWRSVNGLSDTAVCPSGASIPTYASLIANVVNGEWRTAWLGSNGVNATVRIPQCAHPTTPTPTPSRTPVPPTATPTRTPTPTVDPAWPQIEALFRNFITVGCGGGNFCPDRPITRREVAVWLANAMHYNLQPCQHIFADVPCQ